MDYDLGGSTGHMGLKEVSATRRTESSAHGDPPSAASGLCLGEPAKVVNSRRVAFVSVRLGQPTGLSLRQVHRPGTPQCPGLPSNPRPARAATGILIYGCCVSAEMVLRFPTRMRPHHFTRPLSGPPSSTNGVRPPPIPPLRASFLPNVLAISGLPVEPIGLKRSTRVGLDEAWRRKGECRGWGGERKTACVR
ncbi:hypothetical protein FA13DRAFT_1176633 [Coprinellus micaceus]|uniref:Uncharacterized protein n=1 Tax=Coprinellus micaceus TaxID=71717 RepID=A0A4Y7STU6_COPMI|nr:hypothetical protein FA13DRAFT_1176633 [Coprinellus micaceus]